MVDLDVAGDDVRGSDRLVVAPHAGRVVPLDDDEQPRQGDAIVAGQVVGLLEVSRQLVAVHSPFSGVVAEVMAAAGERVRADQPVLWLRVPEHAS